MDLFYTPPFYNNSNIAQIWQYFSGGVIADWTFAVFAPTAGQTQVDLYAAMAAAQASYASAHGYTIANTQVDSSKVGLTGQYSDILGLPASAASYQAIISQAGTSNPTVGITPVNTYSGAPSMTWARTGVGVYTLTAGSAVFSTTKTGIFVQPLTNLNGAIRAVVTSTTVITITTAVQSLAVLGLLGFTATATDALLDKTMVYVQTYP